MPKSLIYKTGYWNVMRTLHNLQYTVDQQIYSERVWDSANKMLIMGPQGEEQEYVQGMMAAITLFEKTGHVPGEEPNDDDIEF